MQQFNQIVEQEKGELSVTKRKMLWAFVKLFRIILLTIRRSLLKVPTAHVHKLPNSLHATFSTSGQKGRSYKTKEKKSKKDEKAKWKRDKDFFKSWSLQFHAPRNIPAQTKWWQLKSFYLSSPLYTVKKLIITEEKRSYEEK